MWAENDIEEGLFCIQCWERSSYQVMLADTWMKCRTKPCNDLGEVGFHIEWLASSKDSLYPDSVEQIRMLFSKKITGVRYLDFLLPFEKRNNTEVGQYRGTMLLLHLIALSDSLYILMLFFIWKAKCTPSPTWWKVHMWEDLLRPSSVLLSLSEHSFFINLLTIMQWFNDLCALSTLPYS